MGATSKHYGDVVIWIEKVIDSCETFEHESAAYKLIRAFEKQYGYTNHMRSIWHLESKIMDKSYQRMDNKIKQHNKKTNGKSKTVNDGRRVG